MDFSNRGTQFNQASNAHEVSTNKSSSGGSPSRPAKGDWSHNKGYRIFQSLLVLCVLVVVAALLFVLVFAGSTSESDYVQNNKLQAVFLNTGQVYFGNIKRLNNNYLVLTNIFYLQTSGGSSSSSSSSSNSTANQTVTLVKLGCEIHAPLDEMVINKESVTFWENLSPSGQVSKAVATWEKENPNGQKCSDQSTAGTAGQNTPQSASNGTTSTSTGTTSTSTGTTSDTSGTKQ